MSANKNDMKFLMLAVLVLVWSTGTGTASMWGLQQIQALAPTRTLLRRSVATGNSITGRAAVRVPVSGVEADASRLTLPSIDPLSLLLHQRHPVTVTTAMAPMVSASDYAFRCLVRQYTVAEHRKTMGGTGIGDCDGDYKPPLAFTQMLHAANLVRDESFFRHHFDIYECSDTVDALQCDLTESQRNAYSDGNYPTIDRRYEAPCAIATRGPVIAQLAGHDAATVVKAAQKIVTSTNGRISGIDLNLGCPQQIARKGNYGAFLMERHPSTACSILKALRQTLPSTITVSAKIRLPYDSAQQKTRLQQLCDTGINFVTIHARDYTENKTTVKHIQLSRLIEAVHTIREYSNNQIPVIVNGGIEFAADAIQIQRQTGAAAVMSSEALLERPNLLGAIQVQQHQLASGATNMIAASNDSVGTPEQQLHNQIQYALDYIKWCYYVPPLSSGLGMKGGSFNVVRGHLFKMLYRFFNDPMNYDLRDHLGNIGGMYSLDQAEALIHTLRQRYESVRDTEWNQFESSRFPESSWYRRHRSASVHVHARINPNARSTNRNNQVLQQQTVADTLSVDDRKIRIRQRIERLRALKKSRTANM